MIIESSAMALIVVGVLIICTVGGQLINNGSSNLNQLPGVQPTTAQLPWTPIPANMTAMVANNIGGESMQYRHYKQPHEDEDADDDQYRDRDYDSSSDARRQPAGVSGPVHTYIKTDKNANFKWGVRHFAGRRYRG